MIQSRYPQMQEECWKHFAETLLIGVYVPEADQISRQDAIELALERDLQAAAELLQDCTA